MSLKIVFLDGKGENIYCITDKRVCQGISSNGVPLWSNPMHDDDFKTNKVSENVYIVSGWISSISEALLSHLKGFSDSKPSEIINEAKKFDRTINPPMGENPCDSATIFGIYDNGELFIWHGEFDGTESLTFAEGNHIMQFGAGMSDKQPKVLRFFLDRIGPKVKQPFPEAMVDALKYSSQIDVVVSPTYDFVHVSKQNGSTETFTRRTLTSDTGKRIEINGDNNEQVYYNADNTEALRLDDDVAVETITIRYNDYPLPPTVTFNMGPGLRLGPPTGRQVTVGRRNITMKDDSGKLQNFIGDGRIQMDASQGLAINDGGGFRVGKSVVVPYVYPGGTFRNMLFVSGILIDDNFIP